jgi:hypothetical protein
MNMGPGGYSRFVRCSFRNVDLRNWICFEVELVDCVFSGRLRRAVFNGTVRKEKQVLLGREHNEFHGNDFSAIDLIDVGFRTGIDLTQQRLPTEPEYLYLPDAAAAVERARSELIDWEEPEPGLRRVALQWIDDLEQDVRDGQQQLFLRADDYYGYSSLPRGAVDKLFSVLRGKSR